ncbi:MAG: tyrosine-type recombinase/integrase [Pseudomonadota bacterium]|nr:tyrosine-type recombinase/integrase [Pseudomonadota bacterium]
MNTLLGHVNHPKGPGDFCIWFNKWRTTLIQQRDANTHPDPARAQIWRNSTKSLISVLGVIENGFADFDMIQIVPADIAVFLDQWEGRRAAQVYRSYLSKFFEWGCRRGIVNSNPAREISLSTPPKRDVYMTDKQYNQIKKALLFGNDGKPTRTGEMVQCYMDLLYLLYQRGTDVRLLRWDQIKDDGIMFKPSKTERTSGIKVLIPISDDMQKVFAKLKDLSKMRSIYLIHTEHGQPYSANGIGSLFRRACKRVNIEGVTLKDIRAKAATDATNKGYLESQLQTALAHTDAATTRGYIRTRQIPVSEVILKLPKIE